MASAVYYDDVDLGDELPSMERQVSDYEVVEFLNIARIGEAKENRFTSAEAARAWGHEHRDNVHVNHKLVTDRHSPKTGRRVSRDGPPQSPHQTHWPNNRQGHSGRLAPTGVRRCHGERGRHAVGHWQGDGRTSSA